MNEREIFVEALEKTPAERSAWLKATCGENAALRERVEALLRTYDDAGSFLETPALEPHATEQIDAESSERSGETADEEPRGPTAVEPPTGEVGSLTGGRLGGDEMSLDFLEPSDEPGLLGRLGPYEITEVIGRGGMGVVLKGQDPKLNRVVAIKVLAPELASNATARKRFLREAQAAAAVSHDHVVTIHAIDEAGNLPYIVMEYVAGWSLQERIDIKGPLDVKEILRIARQTALGLAAAHEQGLIHRDVKPANILLENGIERVKLTDFGLARAVDDVGTTQTGVVAGTPQYMSPEQAQGEHVDHKSDLFSLGCVMYAMCTGRSPFRADSTIAVIRRVCDDTPRPISQVNSDIPGRLISVIGRLLEKRPGHRFESAREVAELLGRYLAHLQHPSQVPLPEVEAARGGEASAELHRPTEAGRSPGTPSPADETLDDALASGPARTSKRASTRRRRLVAAAVTAATLVIALGATEATGVTDVGGFLATVLRIRTPDGTLVVQVDDPKVSVTIDGEDVVITGAGPQEVRLKPGSYRVTATKDGRPVKQELVTIARGGKQVVRISLDAESPSPSGDPTAFDGGADYPRLAPFDAARWDDTTPSVRVNGKWYELLEIDGIPVEKIVAFCRRIDDRWWQKRFEEDLVQVMALMGHRPGRTVQLKVRASDRGETKVLDDVPMTIENRRAVWKSLRERAAGSAGADDDGHQIAEVRRFEGHTDHVSALDVSRDGTFLVSGSADGTARVWDVRTRRVLRTFTGHRDDRQVCAAISPDGGRVATGDWNGLLRIWDQSADKFLVETEAHVSEIGGIYHVAFAANGTKILSTGCDHTARLWDAATGKELVTLAGHAGWVYDGAFFPDGRRAVTTSHDRTMRVWDAGQASETGRLPTQGAIARCVCVSPDGNTVAAGFRDGSVRLFDPAKAAEVHRLKGHTDRVIDVAFTPDGRHLISGSYDRTLRVWDLKTGAEVARVTDTNHVFNTLAMMPDGRHVFSAGGIWKPEQDKNEWVPESDYAIRLWRLPQSVWRNDKHEESKLPPKSAASRNATKGR